MPTTSNFGWTTPADTDLVKDGAAAIRTLGNGIDTSFVDLKGGTTGQVLSKNSNTDLDFTWVTSDDANAIQNAIVDAKGDLIAASAADTPARLAVGNDGETLVADSSTSTGLRWQGNFAAGKNKIINGDFNINQRAFTSNTTSGTYNFDRWLQANSGGSFTVTPQTFTAGTAPVAGYEGKNFLRGVVASQSAASDLAVFRQHIESVRTLAGQTATVSFWAKAASGTPKIGATFLQIFGTGGSSAVIVNGQSATISTSWARYSFTFSVPSISGKTIGTGDTDYLRLEIFCSGGSDYDTRSGSVGIQNNTFDIWGVQVEAGNVATAFQTATGTLAGELQAAQRYYYRFGGDSVFQYFGQGSYYNTTNGYVLIKNPVTMRTSPSSLDYSTLQIYDFSGTQTVTALSLDSASKDTNLLGFTIASGGTQFRPAFLRTNNSTSGYIGLSAEL